MAACGFQYCQQRGTWDQIYYPITDSVFGCFRLLNGTQQIGCQSGPEHVGNTGVVIVLYDSESESDKIQLILEDRYGHAPYIVVFDDINEWFNLQTLKLLEKSGNVAGFILLSDEARVGLVSRRYSDDYSCPNSLLSLYANDSSRTCRWNGNVEGLWFHEFSVPIFLMKGLDNIALIIKQCYDTFNLPKSTNEPRSWPLCATKLEFFMHAAYNAPTCLRRVTDKFAELDSGKTGKSLCQPLGGRNVYAIIPPTKVNQTFEKDSVLIIGTRIDALGMFDSLAPGIDSATSGMLVLLAVIEALSHSVAAWIHPRPNSRNVVFAFFNGEAFEYIGSTRFIYDMQNGSLDLDTLRSEHIGAFVELNQVALSEGGKFWIYRDNSPQSPVASVDSLIRALDGTRTHGISFGQASGDLPPSSAQMFLKEKRSIASLVVTDHSEAGYRNEFYHSFMDTVDQVKKKNVRVVEYSTGLANSVLGVVQQWLDIKNGSIAQINQSFVQELYDCLFVNASCQYLQTALRDFNDYELRLMNAYVMPEGTNSVRSSLLARILSDYLAFESLPISDEDAAIRGRCSSANFTAYNDTVATVNLVPDISHKYASNRYACVLSSTFLSDAVSPAFDISGYDFASGKYSTWVESVWTGLSMTVFLKPSLRWELGVFFLGLCVFALSLVTVYYVDKKADILFATKNSLPVPL